MKRKYFVNLRFIEIFLSRFYSLFIVSTEWAAKEIKILNNFAKIKIIPVGYDSFSESKSGKLDLNDYLLFIGRLEVNQKGLDLLIEALAIGNKNNKLIIAGQGSMKEEMKLKNLISKYNLESRIKLVGRSENEDKISLFKGAKAVVVPSRFETFCLVALETIAFQKPLICFDIPQLSWIPNNFAQKVKSFDLKKMSKMIDLVLLNNPKHLSKLKTRAFLKSFKWVNVAKEFERSVRIYI